MTSLTACINYCASLGMGSSAGGKCEGITWVQSGQAQQYCYPKSDTAVPNSRPFTAGLVAYSAVRTIITGDGQVWAVNPTIDYRTGTNYYGTGYQVKTSLSSCVTACDALGTGCQAAVWVESGQAQQYCYYAGDNTNIAAMGTSLTAFGVNRMVGTVGPLTC